ncbi:MAG: C25 family cysteine peptidase [candidate division WOR-3 bacterium]
MMKFLIVFFLVMIVSAGELIQSYTFNPADLKLSKEKGYDVVQMAMVPPTEEIGAPQLPAYTFAVCIPPTAVATGIEVVSMKEVTIPGEYYVYPAQPGLPLSETKEPPFVAPDPHIYNSSRPYPSEVIEYVHTGSKGGFRVVDFFVYPVHYQPKEHRLSLITNLVVKIHYQENVVAPVRKTSRQLEYLTSDLMTLVSNPEDLRRFRPPEKDVGIIGSPYLPPGNYEHVILTPSAFKDTMQKLADWRTKLGVPSRVCCIESVSVYPGRDIPEKMRNFIKDADTTWGTSFFFIARQDHPVQQYRRCRAIYSSYRDTLPCDMYFTDLDRTWDCNRNGTYGEFPFATADSVDCYSDVYVGMITIDQIVEASRYLAKLFRFEKNPDTTYIEKALLPANVSEGYPNHDSIAMATPPDWIDCRMYTSGGSGVPPTRRNFTDSLNAGYGHGAYYGHGLVDALVLDDGNWTSNDAIALTNVNKLNVFFSAACDCGGFDRTGTTNGDCLAENMAVHAPNGFVGIMMNSRYGWRWVANFFNQYYFYKILPYGAPRCSNYCYLGQAVARTKDNFVPRYGFTTDSSRWRWEAYEKNIFGDPALRLWNDRPKRMTVSHPISINVGNNIPFTVTVDGNYAPLESVLVCLWKGTEVYARGFTNSAGQVTLIISPRTAGNMFVTASKQNRIPYEGNCTVNAGVSEEVSSQVRPFKIELRPNPFQRLLFINLQTTRTVNLKIYDITGKLVRSVNTKQSFVWRGEDEHGNRCPAGIYFLNVKTENINRTYSLILLR